MIIIAEIRPLIVGAIPEIVTLLKDDDSDVRNASADALLHLSEQGERTHLSCRIFCHNNCS